MFRLCLALAAIVSAVFATQAAADTVTGNVLAGTLSLSSSAGPAISFTLNGSDQSVDYTLPFSVIDATGSGTGWNLTVTSTQFTTGGGSPKTLPTDSSKMRGRTSACTAGTCTNATNSINFPPPQTIPAGSTPPTALKFFQAAASSGRGSITVTPTIRMSLQANAYAGIYTSTLTVAVVSGP